MADLIRQFQVFYLLKAIQKEFKRLFSLFVFDDDGWSVVCGGGCNNKETSYRVLLSEKFLHAVLASLEYLTVFLAHQTDVLRNFIKP